MTTIKINSDVESSVADLFVTISEYIGVVSKAETSFETCLEILQGEGYEELKNQINKKIDGQKTVVAECRALLSKVRQYIQDMVEAEESACFPD